MGRLFATREALVVRRAARDTAPPVRVVLDDDISNIFPAARNPVLRDAAEWQLSGMPGSSTRHETMLDLARVLARECLPGVFMSTRHQLMCRPSTGIVDDGEARGGRGSSS